MSLVPVRLPNMLSDPRLLGMDVLRRMRVRPPPELSARLVHLPQENRVMYATTPSIVALPRQYRRSLRAAYAVVMKVQNHNNCYRPMSLLPSPCVVLQGFRLLDAQRKPVPGREALLAWSGKTDSTCTKTAYEDCRLVVDGGKVLLLCKTMVQAIHLALSERAAGGRRFHCRPPLECPGVDGEPLLPAQTQPGGGAVYVVSGAGLDITMLGNRTNLAESPAFCGDGKIFCGKNNNMFSAPVEPASSEYAMHVERWVLGPFQGRTHGHGPQSAYMQYAPGTEWLMDRHYREVGLATAVGRFARRVDHASAGRRLHQVISLSRTAAGGWRAEETLQTSEGYELMKMVGPGRIGPKMPSVPHGGGCCLHSKADLRLGTPEVLIGCSHYHTPGYQYLQQFYAFKAEPPFEVVALSDPFCWVGKAWKKRAYLFHQNESYPCPAIQMTMSITQKAGDPDTILFGVGMNDCEGRVVEMARRNVLGMLFPETLLTRRRGFRLQNTS